jgi:hypothetical protein
MPSNSYGPGDNCYCDIYICNDTGSIVKNVPLFVLLEAYGVYYYAPTYTDTDYDYYFIKFLLPGEHEINVLPGFAWPETGTEASGIKYYAGMTDTEMLNPFGEMDEFEFGWHQ